MTTEEVIYRIQYRRYGGSREQTKIFRSKGAAARFLTNVTTPSDSYGALSHLAVEYVVLPPWTDCHAELADYRPVSRTPRTRSGPTEAQKYAEFKAARAAKLSA